MSIHDDIESIIEYLRTQKTPSDFQSTINVYYRNNKIEHILFKKLIRNELVYLPFFSISRILNDDFKVLDFFEKIGVNNIWDIDEYNIKYEIYLNSINKEYLYDWDIQFVNNIIRLSNDEEIDVNYVSPYDISHTYTDDECNYIFLKKSTPTNYYIDSQISYIKMYRFDDTGYITLYTICDNTNLEIGRFIIDDIDSLIRKVKLQMIEKI